MARFDSHGISYVLIVRVCAGYWQYIKISARNHRIELRGGLMLFVHTLSVFFLLSDPRQFKSTINIAVGWQAFRISICDFSEFTASSRSTLSTKHKAIARDNRPPSSYISHIHETTCPQHRILAYCLCVGVQCVDMWSTHYSPISLLGCWESTIEDDRHHFGVIHRGIRSINRWSQTVEIHGSDKDNRVLWDGLSSRSKTTFDQSGFHFWEERTYRSESLVEYYLYVYTYILGTTNCAPYIVI